MTQRFPTYLKPDPKHLKKEENRAAERLIDGLQAADEQTRKKKLKSMSARPVFSMELFRSPYPLERIQMNPG
ncbi:MAG: hypothetical protein V1792_21220, partial [Pseudomonadota bacterium]